MYTYCPHLPHNFGNGHEDKAKQKYGRACQQVTSLGSQVSEYSAPLLCWALFLSLKRFVSITDLTSTLNLAGIQT